MSAEENVVSTEIQTNEAQPVEVVLENNVTQEARETDKSHEEKGEHKEESLEQTQKKNPVQPRIDELTRKAREAEREAAYWKYVAESTKESAAPKTAAQSKPTPDAFDDYGDYVEALADWKATQIIDKRLEAREAQGREQSKAEQAHKSFRDREASVRATIPDYDEVIQSSGDLPMSEVVGKALLSSEQGPALAYFLAKNPSELDRLNAISDPISAAMMIGRIEAKLNTQPVKQPSKAPDPISPISGGRNVSKDPSNMSMDEYVAYRKSQGARWSK